MIAKFVLKINAEKLIRNCVMLHSRNNKKTKHVKFMILSVSCNKMKASYYILNKIF